MTHTTTPVYVITGRNPKHNYCRVFYCHIYTATVNASSAKTYDSPDEAQPVAQYLRGTLPDWQWEVEVKGRW